MTTSFRPVGRTPGRATKEVRTTLKLDLEFDKKQAKALLRAFRSGDPAARSRVASHLKKSDELILAEAQLVIARERGFASWTKLKRHAEAQQPLAMQVERFLAAIRDRRAATAKRLLSQHPAIAGANVFTAACCGAADVLEQSLRGDASAIAGAKHEPDGFTPLLYLCSSPLHAGDPAAQSGILRCARLLLDAGADPNSSTLFAQDDEESKLSALYFACVSDNAPVVRLLLERGAAPNDGESLYHAAELNHVQCLELLLAHGADPSGKHPHWDNTPLYFLGGYREQDATVRTATEGMRWLLEHGADPNLPSLDIAETPLHRVAQSGGRADAAALLLAHGADPQLPRADGRTAWALAVRTGNTAVADVLVAHGVEPTAVRPVDELLGACMRADGASAQSVLAENQELLEALTPVERGILGQAAVEGKTDSVRLMADVGFDLGWESDWGGTALHHAAWFGKPDAVRLLLDLGAPVDVRDSRFGSSPLAWAAHGSTNCRKADDDYCKVLDALIDAGAEYAASINRWNEPPQSMASRRVVKHLAARGFAPSGRP